MTAGTLLDSSHAAGSAHVGQCLTWGFVLHICPPHPCELICHVQGSSVFSRTGDALGPTRCVWGGRHAGPSMALNLSVKHFSSQPLECMVLVQILPVLHSTSASSASRASHQPSPCSGTDGSVLLGAHRAQDSVSTPCTFACPCLTTHLSALFLLGTENTS